MGPKKRPAAGRKGAKTPVKEEDPAEQVTHLMRQMFEIQMVDIEKKIDRLEKRKVELGELTKQLELSIAEHKKDSGVVIEEKKSELEQKEEERLRKREEVKFLRKEANECKVRLEDGIRERKKMFEEMVEELTKQAEAMEEDYRVLEEFKVNKSEYTRLLEQEEQEVEEAERQHQRNLFALTQKLEMAKFRLKKGAEQRLLLLSLEFQETSRIRIGPPVHRMLQENRAIENELKNIKSNMWDFQVGYEASKEAKKHTRQRVRLMAEEGEKFIARCIVQRNIIETLEKKNEELAETLKTYLPLQLENDNLTRKHKTLEMQAERKKSELFELGCTLAAKREEAGKMSEVSAFMRKTTRKLQILVRNALRAAEEALVIQVIPMGETEEERFLSTETKLKLYQRRRDVAFRKKGKILKNLQEIILRAQISEDERQLLSSESICLDYMDFVGLFTIPSQGEIVQEELHHDQTMESKASFGVSVSDVSLPRSEGTEEGTGIEQVGEEEEEEEEEEDEEDERSDRLLVGEALKVMYDEELEWGGEGEGEEGLALPEANELENRGPADAEEEA